MAPAKRSPDLAKKINQLRLNLAPIVLMPSGPAHPDYPKTILHFFLLTEEQLDSIAHYYHQSTPTIWTNSYPAPMNWDAAFFARQAGTGVLSDEKRVEIKRRKLGKFIGIRGCETPVEEVALRLQLLEAELIQNLRQVEGQMLPGRKWV
ncbi:MAG: hypothetical protein Q9165_003772 [Trypethelium subeluteriae]